MKIRRHPTARSDSWRAASSLRGGRLIGLALLALLLAVPAKAGAASERNRGAGLALPGDLPPEALAEGARDRDEARLHTRLLVHPDSTGAVGVLFDIDPGWHLYWRNPGDSGLATEIVFWTEAETRLEGETTREQSVDALTWPTPKAFGEPDGEGQELITYGYDGRVLLTARFPEPLRPGQRLHAEVRALVCERQCIPATLSLSREVPATRPGPAAERSAALFAHFLGETPRHPETLGARLEALWSQSALRPGDVLEGGIALTSCAIEECLPLALAAESVTFFPEASDTLSFAELGHRRLLGESDNVEVLALRASIEGAPPPSLRGVLVASDPEGRRRGLIVDLPLQTAAAAARVDRAALPWADTSTRHTRDGPGLLAMLWFAFLGGLILNLMPCVLPILAIKVFSVAELAHRDRREVLAHGAAYSAGILVTMSALAGVVVALRSAGHSVGWGFQFQEPLFVAFVCTVVVVFALNLLGVFEIHFNPGRLADVGAEAAGPRRSFFEGLLAVVLATPCSAPFLGTAVGFAFSSSAFQIFGVFAAIGVGLAAPYALVTAVPAWSHIIPRPGPWMVKLRAGLGFLLLGSAVWLVWVIGRSAGLDSVTSLLAFLLFVAFLVWVYGNLPENRPAWVPAGIAGALVAVALLGANGVALEPATSAGATKLGAVYDVSAIETELAAGRSVFAYFTADWCITCKVNERRVLSRPEVRAELERRDVAVFRGDWTHRDEAIRAELARYGKAGVPVYIVRHPDTDAVVLPELLSEERLFAALSKRDTE